jgi:hypothetical protein
MQTIADLEKSLGFQKPIRQLAKDKGSAAVVGSLFLGIETIKQKYVAETEAQLRENTQFATDVEELLDKHGSTVWPDVQSTGSPVWLIDATQDKSCVFWQRNLTFRNDKEQSV